MFLRLCSPSQQNSFFLFGARGTGKTTFVTQQFLIDIPPERIHYIDLLDSDQEEIYLRSPKLIESLAGVKKGAIEWIVLDEVQRIPRLLNHVQRMITQNGQKFILLGSSARKLKKSGANLLGGRAWVENLFPFSSFELGGQFNLTECLRFGSLPALLSLKNESDKIAHLRAYCRVYMKEEVLQEQLVRKIEPFREFLGVSAQASGEVVNFSHIGQDVGADPKTVETYFQILTDTWLGFILPSYHRSVRKAQIMHPKFYWFDLGVKHMLEGILDAPITPASSQYGRAFEHWVIQECFRLNETFKTDYQLSYLRTKQDHEIDLILSKGRQPPIPIEIKSGKNLDEVKIRKFSRLCHAIGAKKSYWLSLHEQALDIEGVTCLRWDHGLQEIFSSPKLINPLI